MKKILVQTVLVVALAAGAAGTWRFATLILHEPQLRRVTVAMDLSPELLAGIAVA